MKNKLLLAIFCFINLVYGKPFYSLRDDVECKGYNACAPIDLNKINVHLIPHSHDDVGWLSTVDQYYVNQVNTIISSVVGALLQNDERRFIQVETAFFKKWWVEQGDLAKSLVKQLIDEGRLEMIGGGWSMNDEAAAHYQSTIDQFTLGINYLQDNLGKCARPRIGWQIDPFGHSREQASLFTQLGFDGFYFARLDYRDRDKRKSTKTMDLLWTGSANLGSDSNIFTSAFDGHYSAPGGFCFDVRCGDDLINADEESPDYNLEKRVNDFVDVIKGRVDHYPTDNILITLGDDFKWESAERSFNNIDKLIKGFAKYNPTINNKEINVIYSTPSCYAKAVNDFVVANNIVLDVKTDDFMPYADGPNRVWSGYYTSRPTSKRYERISNNLLQVTRQLTTLGDLPKGTNVRLEEAVGFLQHHDGITGTEKTAVEKDYHRSASIGIAKAVNDNSAALTNILGLESDIGLKICPLANVSICEETVTKAEINILLYNPLARTISYYPQIPVTGDQWTVLDPEGNELETVITQPIRSFDYVTKVTGDHLHDHVIIFKAADIPGLGYKQYKIVKKINNKTTTPKKLELKEDTKFGFDDKYVVLDSENGRVKSITLNGLTLNVDQEIKMYKSSQNSGAYIFRPSESERSAISITDKVENTILTSEGNVVREIKQVWSDWATQIIRIYKDENFIEFDYVSGPINYEDGEDGREMILSYSTNVGNDGVFYTDSNGRELIYRKRNWRATYDYSNEEPQAGNYYPIVNRIVIEDNVNRFAVITDRSHGASSLDFGQVEVMVNRAMKNDDGYGVGENLNEQEYDQGLVSRGSHFITLGLKELGPDNKTMAACERDIALRRHLTPWLFFTENELKEKQGSFLKKELPENIHLLTLDKYNDADSSIIIRLEHILEKDDDSNLSVETTVDLKDLFSGFSIVSLQETLLAANLPLSESTRLKWPQVEETDKSSILSVENRILRDDTDLQITLAPMQIRTFIAKIQRN